jgi:hypothetical protein
MCPRDKPFPHEKEEVRVLAYAKLHAFDYQTHGQFFWNFRTEFETRWDFQRVSYQRLDVFHTLILGFFSSENLIICCGRATSTNQHTNIHSHSHSHSYSH